MFNTLGVEFSWVVLYNCLIQTWELFDSLSSLSQQAISKCLSKSDEADWDVASKSSDVTHDLVTTHSTEADSLRCTRCSSHRRASPSTLMLILVSVGGPSAPRAKDFFRFSLTSVSLSSSSTRSSSFCLHSVSSLANRCSTPWPAHTHKHTHS